LKNSKYHPLYPGFTKAQIQSVLPQLRKDNIFTLRNLSSFSGTCFVAASFFPLLFKHSLLEFFIYLSMGAICFLFFGLAVLSLKKNIAENSSARNITNYHIEIMLYTFFMIAFGIYIGVIKNTVHPATQFFLFILCAECLFTLNICWSAITIIVTYIPFIWLAVLFKEKSVWIYDIISCVMTLLLCIFFWIQIVTNKIKQRLEEHSLSEANAALYDMSIKDPLTKLYNRRKFNEEIQKILIARDISKSTLAVSIIDIDNFCFFNEMYGHDKGDDALVQISQILIAQASRHNIVVCRWGGEEFMAIELTSTSEEAEQIAEETRAAVEALHITNRTATGQRYLTVSIGLHVLSGQHTETWEEIYHNTSELLFHAKKTGKNKVEFSLN